jgi:hypothetical protein
MRTALITLALVLPCSGLAAQAPAQPVSSTRVAEAEAATLRPHTKSRARVVELEELQGMEAGSSALAAIRRLRPEFLARHAPPRPGEVGETGYAVVYLDGTRLGGPETLETIPLSFVYRIRFLRASETAAWVGREHRGGVIAVSTTR